jgi:hypothetical protein
MRRCGHLWESLTSFENLYAAARKARRGKRAKAAVERFEFDFVKEQLRCRHYVRYCDDFVILDEDKPRLGEVRDRVEQFLLGLRLWLHPQKRTISRVEDGLRLLGYRVWPDHRRLDRSGLVRFCRRLRTYRRLYRYGRLSGEELTQRIRAWIGHACHADTWRLRADLLCRKIFVGPAASPSRAPRRLLEQQAEQQPVCQPQQEHPRQPEQQHRFPLGEHCNPDSP